MKNKRKKRNRIKEKIDGVNPFAHRAASSQREPDSVMGIAMPYLNSPTPAFVSMWLHSLQGPLSDWSRQASELCHDHP
jgi:hypothetical protein